MYDISFHVVEVSGVLLIIVRGYRWLKVDWLVLVLVAMVAPLRPRTTDRDEDSFGTLLMDDPGDDDLHAGLWWTDVDCAMRSYVHDYEG